MLLICKALREELLEACKKVIPKAQEFLPSLTGRVAGKQCRRCEGLGAPPKGYLVNMKPPLPDDC